MVRTVGIISFAILGLAIVAISAMWLLAPNRQLGFDQAAAAATDGDQRAYVADLWRITGEMAAEAADVADLAGDSDQIDWLGEVAGSNILVIESAEEITQMAAPAPYADFHAKWQAVAADCGATANEVAARLRAADESGLLIPMQLMSLCKEKIDKLSAQPLPYLGF